MSGYGRDRRDYGDRGGDRDRSSHRGYDRDDRRGGGDRYGDRDRDRGGYGDRGGRGGRGRGGRGGGRGRGGRGGGRGGMKRPAEVNFDEKNYPGQKDVNRCKAANMVSYDPLKTKYSQLENSDVRREIDSVNREADMDIPKMPSNQQLEGRQIALLKNEFKINLRDEDRVLTLWRVEINPLTSGKFDKALKKEDLRNTIHEAEKLLGVTIAFDGSELAVTHQDLSVVLEKDRNVINNREDSELVIKATCTSQKKPRDCEIKIRKVHSMNWKRIAEYMNGESDQMPSDVIQVLDIILKSQVCKDVAFCKKGMMVPRGANIRMDQPVLTEGRQVWNGIHQSARISSWKTELGNVNHLTLNIDLSYTQVMKAGQISELLEKEGPSGVGNLAAALKHLTFKNSIDNKYYKLEGFGKYDVASCKFDRNDRPRNVLDYWANKARESNSRFNVRDCNSRLVPVKIKQGKSIIEMPAEACVLLPGQKPKTMSEKHKGDMIRASAEPAPDRLEKIKNLVADPDMYAADEFKKFGFEVDQQPMEATGTVLEAPTMLDGDNAEIKIQGGEWRTRKFYKACSQKQLKWMTVFIDNERVRCDRRTFESDFVKDFIKVGQQLGVNVDGPLKQEQVRDAVDFEKMAEAFANQNRNLSELNFVLICGGSNGDQAKRDYEYIKLISESHFGCLTQFVRGQNVSKEVQDVQRGKKPEICRNLWLKLNEKMSGTNWKIDCPLPPSPKPVMVVGCSFSHAEADDDGEKGKPTFVGFTATTRQGGTGYVNHVAYQDPRLNIVCYHVMRDAIKNMMGKFQDANGGALPEKLIWYRGGASTGSYQQILKNEMKVIRDICSQKEYNGAPYNPAITFVVCVRNSHSKLFAKNASDRVGEGQNVPAGTVVTGYGGSPDSFHFHLCSHAGVGTVNPTFYQVLHDDNNLTLQNVTAMTNAFTMDSKRCERSISEPAPVRLASLRAERAMVHWNGALAKLEEARGDRGVQEYLGTDGNKIKTRSRFTNENFYI